MPILSSPKKRTLWILAWVLASVLIFLCIRQIEWDQALIEFKKVSPLWLATAIAFNLSILIFWAWQWIAFLPKTFQVKFLRMIEINALMAMMSNTVPFLAGQALGVVLLARREKVGHAVALSVLTLDQIAEGFGKLCIFLLAALLAPIPDWMKAGIYLAVAAVVLLFSVSFILAHRHQRLKLFMDQRSHPKLHKIWHHLSRWAQHLEGLRSLKVFAFGLLMVGAMKSVEGLAIYSVQKSFGLDLPFWTIFLIMATVSLATMVPVAPANLGVYEAAAFFMYQYLGIPPEQALGLALFQHLCLLIPIIGAGYCVLLIRNFFPLPSEQAALKTSTAE